MVMKPAREKHPHTYIVGNGDDDVLIVGIQAHDAGGKLAGHVLRIPDHLVLPPAPAIPGF
jgi:hypothetical protein